MTVAKTCEKVLRCLRLKVEHVFNNKREKNSFLNEMSYNKTIIDFNFGRPEDLSTLKSDIHLGLVASVNYHFFGLINPYVYLIEVNNCIIYRHCREKPCLWGFANNTGASGQSDQRLCYSLCVNLLQVKFQYSSQSV